MLAHSLLHTFLHLKLYMPAEGRMKGGRQLCLGWNLDVFSQMRTLGKQLPLTREGTSDF